MSGLGMRQVAGVLLALSIYVAWLYAMRAYQVRDSTVLKQHTHKHTNFTRVLEDIQARILEQGTRLKLWKVTNVTLADAQVKDPDLDPMQWQPYLPFPNLYKSPMVCQMDQRIGMIGSSHTRVLLFELLGHLRGSKYWWNGPPLFERQIRSFNLLPGAVSCASLALPSESPGDSCAEPKFDDLSPDQLCRYTLDVQTKSSGCGPQDIRGFTLYDEDDNDGDAMGHSGGGTGVKNLKRKKRRLKIGKSWPLTSYVGWLNDEDVQENVGVGTGVETSLLYSFKGFIDSDYDLETLEAFRDFRPTIMIIGLGLWGCRKLEHVRAYNGTVTVPPCDCPALFQRFVDLLDAQVHPSVPIVHMVEDVYQDEEKGHLLRALDGLKKNQGTHYGRHFVYEKGVVMRTIPEELWVKQHGWEGVASQIWSACLLEALGCTQGS